MQCFCESPDAVASLFGSKHLREQHERLDARAIITNNGFLLLFLC